MASKDQHSGSAAPGQGAVTVASAEHVLTLVASCVVNQRAFANTCGVPLGAHLDFLPSSGAGLPQVTSRPPLRCSGCSGFLNVYCKTNLQKWVWKCNMCGNVNINKDQLGHSVDVATYPELCSEAVEYVQPLAAGSLSPALPPPDQQPRQHLVFAIDTTMDPADLQAAKEALLVLLTQGSHLDPHTLISIVTFDGCVAVHNLGSLRCSHVLPSAAAAAGGGGGSGVTDDQSAVQLLLDRHCAATAAAARSAASGGGGAASAAAAAADVANGNGPGAPAEVLVSELRECVDQLPRVLASLRTVQGGTPLRRRARCLCPAVEAALRLIAAAASLDLTRHHNLYGSRVVVLAGGPATRGPGAVPLELLDQAVSEKGRSPESKAVAAALDVGEALGAMAAKIGVAVDIFTSTATGINARLLTAIAHGSGGELMPQLAHHSLFHYASNHASDHQPPPPPSPRSPVPPSPSFSSSSQPQLTLQMPTASHSSAQSQQAQQDLGANGGGSGDGGNGSGGAVAAAAEGPTGGFIGPLLARQLVEALGRRFGIEGRLDCYCSEGLRLVQWIGPLDPLQFDLLTDDTSSRAVGSGNTAGVAQQDAVAAASAAVSGGGGGGGGAASGPWRLSSAACGVVALEVGRCASLRLEVTRDLVEVPSLLLQVVLHFVDPVARQRVVRVVSRRMTVVDNRADFLRAVNPAAAAALLGKKAVLDAKKAAAFRDSRRAEEARYAVAAQLGLIATRCGKEVQASRGVLGFGGRKFRQWPPELMPLAYALYHFHRGPVLGPPAPPPPGTHPATAHVHNHSLWDSDARLAGINALLWAAWSDAYRCMTPKLFAVLPPPPAVEAAAAAATAPAAPPPPLAALPCVSLAAVMARTVPLLLDTGTAVLVSPTEEPGHAASDAAGGAVTPALLDAALAAAGCAPPLWPGSAAAAAAAAAPAPPRRRVPVPSVVLAPGAQAGGGALAARLIPSHHDAYDEQALQHPQLQQLGPAVAAQLSKQLREGEAAAVAATAAAAAAAGLPAVQAKQAAAAAASFVQWCHSVSVQPFPLSQ